MAEQLPLPNENPTPGVPYRKHLQVSRAVAVVIVALTLIVGIVLGAIAHSLVSKSDQAQPPEGFPRDGSGFGNGGPPGQGSFRSQNGLTGTVTAIANDSITVSASDGTWTVSLSGNTQYGAPRSESSKTDIAVGDQVAVIGEKDSANKTIGAQRIIKTPQGGDAQQPSAL